MEWPIFSDWRIPPRARSQRTVRRRCLEYRAFRVAWHLIAGRSVRIVRQPTLARFRSLDLGIQFDRLGTVQAQVFDRHRRRFYIFRKASFQNLVVRKIFVKRHSRTPKEDEHRNKHK